MDESLADLLKKYRAAGRLSQEALAERSGLSTRTISDIETGFARTPRLISVMLIAEALGLTEPERLALQQSAGKRSRAAAPSAAGRPMATIAESPMLFGRSDDVAAVRALIERDGTRLVTLVGPAGVGKTSLALRVAFDLSSVFTGGVVLVELAKLTDPSFVPAAVAHALGISEAGSSSVAETVAANLREARVLLVLDNLEHLLPAASWIAEIIAASRHLSVLATTREALHLRLERLYAVGPLDASAAAELFVQRAETLNRGFVRNAENDAAVDTIVRRLEGLPLAIELAAPRLMLLPPKALAARLDRRLPLLDQGPVDLPQRQQTMNAAIAWSYDLLSAQEQRLFARLSVLATGSSLDAAEAVVGPASDGERPFLSRIASLVDKSLLAFEEDEFGEPRIAMLEMLREFAAERLAENGELAAVRERLTTYVHDLALRAETYFSGSDQARWLATLERAVPNIRAVLQWTIDVGDAERGLEIGAHLWRFWWKNGHLTEGITWLRRLLAEAEHVTAALPEDLLARTLRGLVVLLSALGDFEAAMPSCRRAIALQRASGDEIGLANSLTSLGIILQFECDFVRCEEAHTESLEIRLRLGDEAGVANSYSNLASAAITQDQHERATDYAERSAALYRRLDNVSGLVHALTKLGLIAERQGTYERAERYFEECLQLQRSLGNIGNVYSLLNLAQVAFRRDRLDVARVRYREAFALLSAAPNRTAAAAAFEGVAAVTTASGEPAVAARLFGAAETLRRKVGTPHFPAERPAYDASVARTRDALGALDFDTEWRIGAGMSYDGTVDFVLETALRDVADVEAGAASVAAPASVDVSALR